MKKTVKDIFKSANIMTQHGVQYIRLDQATELVENCQSDKQPVDLETIELVIESLFEKHTSTMGPYEPDYVNKYGLIPDLVDLFNTHLTQPAEDKWISVIEMFPDQKQYVLIYGKGGRQMTAFYRGDEFLCYDISTECLETADEITHWQPLPNPPNKK